MNAEQLLSNLDSLAAALPVAVYRTTPEGRFVAGNRALAGLLGAESMDDLLDLDVRDLYVDPATRQHMVSRVEAGEAIPTEEIQIRRLDGREIWVRVSSRGVVGDDGTIVCYEGILEDVTARHTARAALERSHAVLDTVTRIQNRYILGADSGQVFDQLLDDLLAITESDYGFIAQVLHADDGSVFLRTSAMSNIAWNEATRAMFEEKGPRGMEFHNLETLFGRAVTGREAVISNDPRNDTRSGGRPYGHPPLDSFLGVPILRGPDVLGMIALSNRPGGYDEAIVAELQPIVATAGSMIEALRADAARREAEAREQSREALYRTLVEYAAEAVIAFRDDGTVEAFNPAAERMTGFAESEMLGQSIREVFAAGAVEPYVGTTEEATAGLVMRHRDGGEIPVEVSFGRAEIDDGALTTAVIRDIAERIAIETALREARDTAERTSRAKDEFLAGMSHELRTPLNAVIGLSTILSRRVHGPVNEKQGEYLAQIEASGRHLLELINDILDLAKIEADKLEPEMVATDVGPLIGTTVAVVRETALAKRLDVSVDIPEDLPPVSADARRTKQVLLNLLSNAIKFTESGGSLGVRAEMRGDRVAVTVWDTGVGIPANRLDDIFTPFEQVDSSLARTHSGTGLGLALSRRFIEMQGGELTVTSVEGKGSQFTFVLRQAGSPTTDAREVKRGDEVTVEDGSGLRVLVVEDNDINRLLVTDYLAAQGVEVAVARDGDEAVRQATTLLPDVILMDVQLPGRDGLSATRELKAAPATSGIPVIALTAMAMKGDAERCLEAGCDGYLSKPCDPAEVLDAVKDAADRRRGPEA